MIFLIYTSLFIMGVAAVPSGYSGHLQHISVPNYNPKLEFLGQHVDLPEIPTKVIRITKTVAVKVPVPYPVKVPHHVPYPVQVNKPYPVPVTQIVKIPEPVPVPVHSGSGSGHGGHEISSQDGLSQGYGGSGYTPQSQAYGSDVGQSQSYRGSDYPGYDQGFHSQGGYQQELSNSGNYGGQGYGEQIGHGYSGSEHYGESNQVLVPASYSNNYDNSQGVNVLHGSNALSGQHYAESISHGQMIH